MSPTTSPPSPPNPAAENSDDSLLVNELSFDYVVDETGKPIRLTKSRSTKSTSPPPTSADPIEPAALRRNNSLSSSESAFQTTDPSPAFGSGPSASSSRPFLRSNSGPVAPSAPRRTSSDKGTAIPRRAELDLRAERDQLLSALPEEKENAGTYIESDSDYDKFAKSARRASPPRGQPVARTSSHGNVGNPPLPQRRAPRQYDWGAASRVSEGETTDQDEEEAQTAQNKAPLGRSANNRPRRSASFSDALATEENHNALPSTSRSSGGHRPVSSLGINGFNNYEPSSEQPRPRTSLGLSNEDDGKAPAHRKRIDEEGKSPSSPHGQPQGKARSAYGHRRRDSDTLRSASQSNLAGSNSNSPAGDVPGRQSPAGRVPLSQRRSPAGSEPPAKGAVSLKQQASKIWSGGEESEDRGRSKAAPAPPPPPQAQQQQPMYMMPVAQARHMMVNKHTYTRLDLIGKGGSSRVYRVLNSANEVFAIKRVSLDKIDQETMQGYLNEIQLLKRLNGNARIIRLVESELKSGGGANKGTLLLVMECGEIDFARLLAEQAKLPLNMVWVAYYWQQMLQAVQIVHDEKIVHSDLKPANFVLVKGQLKLIDFGIANAIANDTTNIQRDHQIGTVNYMSPEAIELPEGMRRLKVGRPSDVWSLGCILYQMIYGLPPFHHLNVYVKMKAIPDHSHTIEFPEFSTPTESTIKASSSSNGNTPPKRMSHLKKRVRKDVIETMKRCLTRFSKERATIPELLEEPWVELGEEEPKSASSSSSSPASSSRPALGKDEVIMNPHYMRQLLEYAKNLPANVSEEFLENDAKRLVAELKRVSGPHQ